MLQDCKESWLLFISKKSVSKMSKRNVLTKKSRNGGSSKDLEGHLCERLSIFALLLSKIGGHVPSMPLQSSAGPEIRESLAIKL